MASKVRSQFAIIGAGQFGKALARQLIDLEKEVLVVDIKEEFIASVNDFVTHSVVADATDENVLKAIGIAEFDVVVVCIGNNMEASILATLLCKQLGVKYVVAKAQSEKHRIVLEKIGADTVVFPEEYMGKKVATMLVNPSLGDFVDLSDTFKLAEIKAPEKWDGKTLSELNVRRSFDVSIIIIKKENGDVLVSPGGESIVNRGDSLMICGTTQDVNKIANKVLSMSE